MYYILIIDTHIELVADEESQSGYPVNEPLAYFQFYLHVFFQYVAQSQRFSDKSSLKIQPVNMI